DAHHTVVGGEHTGNDLEQARLARAVGSDEGDLFAVAELERDVEQNVVAAVGLLEIRNAQHGLILLMTGPADGPHTKGPPVGGPRLVPSIAGSLGSPNHFRRPIPVEPWPAFAWAHHADPDPPNASSRAAITQRSRRYTFDARLVSLEARVHGVHAG